MKNKKTFLPFNNKHKILPLCFYLVTNSLKITNMKRKFLILIFCAATNAFAQDSFPTSNAIWNESIYVNGISRTMLYGLLGDTIINDILYSKLYQLSDTVLSGVAII